MTTNFVFSRLAYFAIAGVAWLASAQTALAQPLLAQTGTTKTAIGWLIVLLCIGLGLLVVCRPGRKAPDWRKK